MCIAAMCIACFDRVLLLTQYQLSAVISHRGCAMYIENKRLYYNILSVVEIYCVDYFKTHLADQQQKIIYPSARMRILHNGNCMIKT